MPTESERGFGAVLTNRNFRSLWGAQALAQTAQNAIQIVQMALIEQLTGSTVMMGVVILAFTLPGVIFSPVAGVLVDRFSKKTVLVVSNAARVLFALSYVLVLTTLNGTWELLAIYAITFAAASVAQFFYPAEGATIPLLVGEDRLLAANSLFNLTMNLSLVAGLLFLGPLIVEILGAREGFLFLALLYLGATVLVALLPKDAPGPRVAVDGVSRWRSIWQEARDGWKFVVGHQPVKVGTEQMVTINTLVMILAMIAPGYAARVLGLGPQNMIIVFMPAGIGMLLATGLVGRWGRWLRRAAAPVIGLALAGLAFAALGLLNLDYNWLMRPILSVYPHMAFSLTSATMVIAFILGLALSGVNILAQTTIQEESPANYRGRVYATLFMLNAVVGIPPMLVLGEMADRIGIPRVLIIIGLAAIAIAGWNLWERHPEWQSAAAARDRQFVLLATPYWRRGVVVVRSVRQGIANRVQAVRSAAGRAGEARSSSDGRPGSAPVDEEKGRVERSSIQ